MRGHKFVIIVGDSYILEDYDLTQEVSDQIEWNEDPYLAVVTLPHENFSDNVVVLTHAADAEDETWVVRDVRGRLWYYMDVMSKMDLILNMEQTED